MMRQQSNLLLTLLGAALLVDVVAQIDSATCWDCFSQFNCKYCLSDISNSTLTNSSAFDFAGSSAYECVCDEDVEETTCVTTAQDCYGDIVDFGDLEETFGDVLGFATWIFGIMLACFCLCTIGGIVGCICCCCPPERRNQPGVYVQQAQQQQQQPAKATVAVASEIAPPMATAVVVEPAVAAETGLTAK